MQTFNRKNTMKNQINQTRQGLHLFVATIIGIALVTPSAWAGRGGVRSSNRNVNVNRNANVNVNRNANINVHHNVDVNVHHGGYYHDDNHFWGGFAAGLVIGAVISTPPPNPQPVVVQNVTYIVSDGVYYQTSGSGYVVVNPPIGVIVPTYPPGAVQTIVNDQVYYLFNGIYYRPAMQNGVTVYTTVRF
jgi:hypothetical protein